MDYIEKVLEKLKEWARKLIEALLGPDVLPEPEPIPIPVNDPKHRRQIRFVESSTVAKLKYPGAARAKSQPPGPARARSVWHCDFR